ncbi:MAG: phenylacetate--CoA ligase [Kiritimatiellae bacterium]|nr:phenylacetate--CoA ligase [Kiritimatiellia bacterium]
MKARYHNEKAETMSRDEIADVQNRGLKRLVRHVMANNDWYRARFEAAGIEAESFRGLEDLGKLPFMSKRDFREQYPLGMCCVPKTSLAEMHMSSGSTGTPVVMPYTKADIAQWADCMARCYAMAGALPGDTCQITPGFGLFNGGFGFYHGAQAAGLFVVPTGSGNTARQVTLARDFHTRVLGSVVSYSLRIMEVMEQMNVKLPDLKIGIFGAESFSDEMKTRIHDGLGIEAFDIYGMTETGGVGTLGQDCQAHCGLHQWEDQYIVEIVDPKTGAPVPDGEIGEVVATSLTREALPVVRFRTGDLSRVVSREKCACGRTHLRIDRISGRLDDMLIISGVNFFPLQIEKALLKIPGVLPNYRLVIENHGGTKKLRVEVEAESGVTGHTVAKALKEALGFTPDGEVFAPGSMPRPEGKAKRVFFEDK